MNIHSPADSAETGRDGTRERVLEAALALFAERGYHGTPVPAIAERAGVAAGTLYRHFRGKEELVNVLYRECKRRFMAAFPPLAEGADPRRQLGAILGGMVAHALARPTELEFLELHHHGSYLDAESLAVEEDSFARLDAFFEQPSVRPLVKPLPPRALVVIAWGILAGLFRATRLGHLDWSPDLVEAAEQAAWDAVARTPA